MPHSGISFSQYDQDRDDIDAQNLVFTWRKEWLRESHCVHCPEFGEWMEYTDEEIDKYVAVMMADEDYTDTDRSELKLKLKRRHYKH